MTHCPDGVAAVLVGSLLSSAILKIPITLSRAATPRLCCPTVNIYYSAVTKFLFYKMKNRIYFGLLLVSEIVFMQLVSIQLTCENQSVLIPCQRWAMSYEENTGHIFSLVPQ